MPSMVLSKEEVLLAFLVELILLEMISPIEEDLVLPRL